MSVSRILKAAVLAVSLAGIVNAAQKYTLNSADEYLGTNFFDGFNFYSATDPNGGFVQFQTAESAKSNKFGGPLVSYSNNQAYIGVDYWNHYNPAGVGRPSVRIETKKTYTHGLFVLDLAHMPENICGVKPSFYSYHAKMGEIDMVENIHETTQSLSTLHSGVNCSVSGNKKGIQQTGLETTYNCDDTATRSIYGTQEKTQGCSSVNQNPNNYGKTFNVVGGGVYATEWTSDVIRIWNFSPHNTPSDLVSGSPDTTGWGLPAFTTAKGSCDIDSHFGNHTIVLDTTFCGTWAGNPRFWQQTSCYNSQVYPTCESYVAANPQVYSGVYWLINSMRVYQKTGNLSATSSQYISSSVSSNGIRAAPSTLASSPLKSSTTFTSSTGLYSSHKISSIDLASSTVISSSPVELFFRNPSTTTYFSPRVPSSDLLPTSAGLSSELFTSSVLPLSSLSGTYPIHSSVTSGSIVAAHSQIVTATRSSIVTSRTTNTALASSMCVASPLINGDFEKDSIGPWAVDLGAYVAVRSTSDTGVSAYQGTHYLELTFPAGNSVTLYQIVSVCPKSRYNIAAWGQISGPVPSRKSGKASKCHLQLTDGIKGTHSRSIKLKHSAWNSVTKTFKTSQTQTFIKLELIITCSNIGAGKNNTIYIDNITLK